MTYDEGLVRLYMPLEVSPNGSVQSSFEQVFGRNGWNANAPVRNLGREMITILRRCTRGTAT